MMSYVTGKTIKELREKKKMSPATGLTAPS